jgi:nucleoside-diphosphate-sugar epimerase
MKTFVTGATGFVGANLIKELLNSGYDVHCLVRRNSNMWRLGSYREQVVVHHGDLLDKESVESIVNKVRPEVIFHLGVYGALPTQQENANRIFNTSLIATHYLLNAVRSLPLHAFVNVGSSSEYGKKDVSMCEDGRLDPNNYYAIGKAAQSLLCQHEAREHGLPIVTLRLFSVYGPYEELGRLVSNVTHSALNNEEIKIAAPSIARDFIYVSDVVHALIVASKKDNLAGEIINVGTGVQSTLKEMAETIVAVSGSTSKILYDAYEPRPHDTTTWVADISKMKQLLGITRLISIKDGIASFVPWMRENIKLYEKR